MAKRSSGNSKSATGPRKKSSKSTGGGGGGGGSKSRNGGGGGSKPKTKPVVPTETPAPPLDEHTLAMMLGGAGGNGHGVGDPFAGLIESNGADVDAAIIAAAISTPAPATNVDHQKRQQQDDMAGLLLTAQTSNVTGGGPPAAASGAMVHKQPPSSLSSFLQQKQGGGGLHTDDDVKENDGIAEDDGEDEDEDEGAEEEEEADLNWDAITRFDPARTDVPAYLAARANFDAAKMALSRSIDQYHASLQGSHDALLGIPADIHNRVDETLQGMEDQLRRGFVGNTEKRETIETTLHKSAETARALFDGLLMRMAGVGGGGGGSGNAGDAVGGGTVAGMGALAGGLGDAGGGIGGGK